MTLGKYFQPGRPVIVTLNYYECPMLCTVQLNELVRVLKDMPWTPGQQFEILTVSFNPRETSALARLKKQSYLKEYGRADAAAGWHFLTGKPESIRTLTETVGFQYHWDEATQQYVHVAAAIILTPQGRVSRYLTSIVYDPSTLRLALADANEGKYRSTVDEVLLYCFHYDPGDRAVHGGCDPDHADRRDRYRADPRCVPGDGVAAGARGQEVPQTGSDRRWQWTRHKAQ